MRCFLFAVMILSAAMILGCNAAAIMQSNAVLQKLQSGKPVFGAFVSSRDSAVVEQFGLAGLDYLFIDAEHTSMGVETVRNHIMAAAQFFPSTLPFVRVPFGLGPDFVKPALDSGAAGIIIPNVRSVDEARLAVNSCKYKSPQYPNGTRRVGLGRAQNYGASLSSYVATANNVTALILMAEHIDFVNNCSSILQVRGIDAISLGPADLAASMGLLGAPASDPRVAAAITQIEVCAQKAGIPIGRSVPDRKTAIALLRQGYLLFTGPSDMESIIAAGKQFAE